MSVMLQCYSVIIDCGISAHGSVKDLFDGLNAIDKRYMIANKMLPLLPHTANV